MNLSVGSEEEVEVVCLDSRTSWPIKERFDSFNRDFVSADFSDTGNADTHITQILHTVFITYRHNSGTSFKLNQCYTKLTS